MKKAQSDEAGRAAQATYALLVVFQAAFGVVMRQPENGKTGFQAAFVVIECCPAILERIGRASRRGFAWGSGGIRWRCRVGEVARRGVRQHRAGRCCARGWLFAGGLRRFFGGLNAGWG